MCECHRNDPALVLALVGAASLLGVWMLVRGGFRTMKVSNLVIVVGVVVLVGGVAWYRTTREAASGGSVSAPGSVAASAPAAGERPVAPGELCPEPPPGANTRSTEGGPTSAPAPRKLPRVVDLGADKCVPCKKMAPILDELKKEYEGRVIVDFIDVWKNPKAGEPYKIRVIPTQIFFDADGKEVWRHEGFLPKEEFLAKFAEMGVK
jgi:thioredoxin 1